MDTRAKILGADEVRVRLDGKQVRWISGHFDPLLADHVRQLRQAVESGKLLVVEVTDSPKPLLPARARAELVAALSIVDYVVISDAKPDGAGDAPVTDRFVRHVLTRHGKGSAR